MIERMGNAPQKRTFEYSAHPEEQLPSRTLERNIPRTEDARTREELIAAATPRMTTKDAVQKAALGAGVVVGAPFAATIAGSLLAMLGIHKVMNKVGDFFAGPIVKGILSLSVLNPFKKVWNRIFGGSGGSHDHAHAHDHGGGHGHGHGH